MHMQKVFQFLKGTIKTGLDEGQQPGAVPAVSIPIGTIKTLSDENIQKCHRLMFQFLIDTIKTMRTLLQCHPIDCSVSIPHRYDQNCYIILAPNLFFVVSIPHKYYQNYGKETVITREDFSFNSL